MAVVERRMAQDCVAIYACDTWTQITVSYLFLNNIYCFHLCDKLPLVKANRW